MFQAIAIFAGLLLGDAPAVEGRALEASLRAAVAMHGDGARASVWVGGASGAAWYGWTPDAIGPTASSIKTAFLVELFARYALALDQPPPGLAAILRDDHPAVAHFTEAQRAEVRQTLATASVRRIGRVMMGSDPASNVVYNAAANVSTALLGGPKELTDLIRARDPAFAAISVRRYMLAPRQVTGDNEASPAALAAVLQRVASGKVPGLGPRTTAAIREAILTSTLRHGQSGAHHFKDGALDTDPLTRVQSGWWGPSGGSEPIVYIVMVAQPNPAGKPRAEAAKRLEALNSELTRIVLAAVGKTKKP